MLRCFQGKFYAKLGLQCTCTGVNHVLPFGSTLHSRVRCRCTTCCCKDGLVKSGISSGLTYAGPTQEASPVCSPTQCGVWFTTMDVMARMVISMNRAARVTEYLAPPCFSTNPDVAVRTGETPHARNARKAIQSASAKCNKTNLAVPEDLSKECTHGAKYYLEPGKVEACPALTD